MYILFAILLFGFLIAIHEFGHFIVAKACNVKVNEFSIGMGPLLLSRQGKETLYSLRLLPIGGFCAMEGEDGDSDDERAFSKAAAWKRFLILVAGSLFNVLTGLIIVMCIYSNAASYTEPVLAGFMDGFPLVGEEYLMEGDELYSINGKRVLLTNDVSTILAIENSDAVDVTVRRDGELITIEDLPLVLREYEENGVTVMRYGLYFAAHEASFMDRIKLGVYTSVNFVRNVFWSFEMLFEGSAGFNDLSGPVGIVQTMNEVGEASATVMDAVINLLYVGAFVAVNLSVMNLLPIPALDGGRIFLMLVNGVCMLLFRRKIPEQLEGAIHFVGLVLLLLLMGAVMINDVYKIIT
ncbi:MAG: site-2 protease family protein [Oscillospiraceae bacterium]|nr:site-2 protease family protein [Oscillospiraceae bacterium]